MVRCDSQEEVDEYWQRLIADGGRPVQCGWLRDKLDFNGQIVPPELHDLLADRARASRVMQVVPEMVKMDMAGLRAAAAQG